MKPTEAMYNAGLKYLINRGTAWCVNDLFEVMWEAAEIPNTAYPVHLDFMSDCCGFFMDLRYDGIFCNECGISMTEAIGIQHERIHDLKHACEMALDVLTINGDIENLKYILRQAITKAEGR